MDRGGLAIAMIVSIVAALLFVDLAAKAVDQFRGHVSARAENGEATARIIAGGRRTQASSGFEQGSVSVLSRVSGGSL